MIELWPSHTNFDKQEAGGRQESKKRRPLGTPAAEHWEHPMKTTIQLAAAVLFVTTAVLLWGAPRIQAGVILTAITATVEKDGAANKFVFPKKSQWKKVRIYLDANKLRMDLPDAGIIYRGDLKKIFILSPQDRKYQEYSQDFLQKTREQAARMMERQMASMPPEQRERMKQMMQGQMGTGGKPRTTFKKGKTVVIAGKWKCVFFTTYKNGKKVSENCYARLGDLGLKRGDVTPLETYSKFMSSKPEGSGEIDDESLSPREIRKITGFYGFPVKTVDYEEDGKQSRSELLRVERKRLPSSVFEVPKGYTNSGPSQ